MKIKPFTYDNPFDAADQVVTATQADGKTRQVYRQPFGNFVVSEGLVTDGTPVLKATRGKAGRVRLSRLVRG